MSSTNESLFFLSEPVASQEFVPSFFELNEGILSIETEPGFLSLAGLRDGTEPENVWWDVPSSEFAISMLANWPTGGSVSVYPGELLTLDWSTTFSFLTNADGMIDVVLMEQQAIDRLWRGFIEFSAAIYSRTPAIEKVVLGWELNRKCNSNGDHSILALEYRQAFAIGTNRDYIKFSSL